MKTPLILLAVAGVCATALAQNTGPSPAVSKEVVVDGFRLSYTIEGEGIPCLVINDAPAMRRGLAPGLRSRFKFVFMDPRMNVPYDPTFDLKRITLDTLLDDIERIRREADVDRILVFGHSINGLTAFEYARKYPAHVIAVVMNGSPSTGNRLRGPAKEAFWASVASPERKEIQRKNEERTRETIAKLPPGEAMLQGYIANAAMIWHDPNYDSTWLFEGVCWNAEVWGHLSGAVMIDYDIRTRPPLQAPVLLTLGRDDFAVPYTTWNGIETIHPNLTVRIFEHSGHWAFLEEQALFESTLCEWVDGAVLKSNSATAAPRSPPK